MIAGDSEQPIICSLEGNLLGVSSLGYTESKVSSQLTDRRDSRFGRSGFVTIMNHDGRSGEFNNYNSI